MQSNNFGLASLFLHSAHAYPQRPALRLADGSYSYHELASLARRWSRCLQSQASTVRRVGIFGDRSLPQYGGVLATLLSGGTYVPLNRAFPNSRTREMIQSAQLDAIIVDAACLPALEAVLKGVQPRPRILAPTCDASVATRCGYLTGEEVPCAGEGTPASAEDNAYLLFTSGSTGQPKGVPVTHGSVGHFLAFNSQRYGITYEDRLTATFDLTFDLSVFDMFMAWKHGACLCVPSPLELLSPYQFVRDAAITVWFSVPSVANLLCRRGSLTPNSLPSLRWSLFCGEPLPLRTAQAWAAAAPNSVVENLYGPTELTIACAVYRFDPAESPKECLGGIVPLGHIYPGMTAAVLQDAGIPQDEGPVGELCVDGPQRFAGYWRDEAKTAGAHVRLAHGASEGPEGTYYRTGDRVRYLRPGGPLIFLGRADHQIKISGYRVELDDVEAALRKQSGVAEAVALGWPTRAGSCEGIVGFTSGGPLTGSKILEGCRQALPGYMVPRTLHVVDHWPLNSNGKIDRHALIQGLNEGKF